MTSYSYQETIQFIADQLKTPLPSGEIEKEGTELAADGLMVSLIPGQLDGELSMSLNLGFFIRPLSDDHLRELLNSQFLGINTGGTTFGLDELSLTLSLKTVCSIATPPSESWDQFQRLLSAAYSWLQILSTWEEFKPLTHLVPEGKNG